ncbi:hypothetical protein EYF80_003383 [Liparis tanakae]|uniref:Uncharacterized protein n=1 Tax=Liparis tanakae TaxID=230148 RepID=A0A4Z2J9E3_9TELE|nr:hypothetical protein EYF80_003383 [Liparis tanakae]
MVLPVQVWSKSQPGPFSRGSSSALGPRGLGSLSSGSGGVLFNNKFSSQQKVSSRAKVSEFPSQVRVHRRVHSEEVRSRGEGADEAKMRGRDEKRRRRRRGKEYKRMKRR